MNFFQAVFFSPDEPRLRTGWRLFLHLLIIIFMSMTTSAVFQTLFPFLHDSILQSELMLFFTVTLSVFIARRWIDKRSFSSLGLQIDKKMWLDLLAGISIAFLMAGFVYLIMFSAGWITFKGFAWETEPVSRVILNLFGGFVIFILVGWYEELISRGYQLQNLTDGLNLTWGVIISSAFSGILYLGYSEGTWVNVACNFFTGVFLAYAYIRTGQLWLPIGLHIGGGFFERVIFGFLFAGDMDLYHRLTRITVKGPELWTGGAFGPEAGLVVLPALALGAGLIYLYSRAVEWSDGQVAD